MDRGPAARSKNGGGGGMRALSIHKRVRWQKCPAARGLCQYTNVYVGKNARRGRRRVGFVNTQMCTQGKNTRRAGGKKRGRGERPARRAGTAKPRAICAPRPRCGHIRRVRRQEYLRSPLDAPGVSCYGKGDIKRICNNVKTALRPG